MECEIRVLQKWDAVNTVNDHNLISLDMIWVDEEVSPYSIFENNYFLFYFKYGQINLESIFCRENYYMQVSERIWLSVTNLS